jgi:ribosomal protein S18 acetylase RimI-like enzyme
MITDYIFHKQEWVNHYKYIIANDFSCVQIIIYKEIQDLGLGNHLHAYINDLWVKEEYRRQGYGKYLLERAENVIKENNIPDVYIDFDFKDTGPEILEWYKRSGYKQIMETCEGVLVLKKSFY